MIELALNSNLTLQYAEARPAGMRIASALAADLASFALEVRPFCVPLAWPGDDNSVKEIVIVASCS